MYPIGKEEKYPAQEVKREHITIANDMANHITEFEANLQNEMLKIIREIVAKNRQSEIEYYEKHLAHLKETFQNLL